MPTYEYKCDACGHAFEKFQSITAGPIKKCPHCGKNKVRRLISSGAGLIFKGGGFYITDYRDASYKEKAKADSGAPTETKPAATNEGKSTEAAPAAASSSAESKSATPIPATKSESKSDPKAEPKSSKPDKAAKNAKS
jgi:putative FmdB family regulatory protein